MNHKHRWIYLLIFSILLLGCHKTVKLDKFSDIDKVDLQSILVDLKTRYLMVNSLKTQMNVMLKTKGESQEIREYLCYKQPDKLKIVVFGALNEHKAVALANKGKFTLYFFQENEAIIAPLTDQVLSQIFEIDIRISDIRSAIFSNPFLDGNTENIVSKRSGNRYILQRPSSYEDCTEEIILLMKDENPVVSEWKIFDAKKQLVQKIEFSDYREVGGILRPLKVKIQRIPEKTEVVFNLIKPEINVDIKDSYFELDLPETTKIRYPKE